jgi:TM2 domain-containing membrane protein YozV
MDTHPNGALAMNDVAYTPPQPIPAPEPARRDRFLDDPRRKSPALAAVLSAFPGLGQVYVGYYRHGFTIVAAVVVLIGLLASGAADTDALGPPVGILLAFTWFYNMIDAARRASLYNQALAGLRPMDLPENAKVPAGSGSLAGGVALIVIGTLILAHNVLGLSLAWLIDWWPIGLVAAGAWLVYEDRRAKSPRETP